MKKHEIRKIYFNLKKKGHTNNQCRKILLAKHGYEVNIRTLRRWTHKLDFEEWDLCDKSKRPKTIHIKITKEIEEKVISKRNKTGFGANKLSYSIKEISESSIQRILKKHKLTKPSKRKKKRNNYIRFQRDHPNSLWQIDHSDQKIDDKYVISVVDDCSRKSLAFVAVNLVTTDIVINLIDNLIEIYGKPKQILTDNGSAYGSKSKHSKFDRKLRLRGIEHIRGAVHSPTTQGKVERLFQTFKREFKFCNGDVELWRMRYNHFRPHISLEGKTPDEIFDDFNVLIG